MHLIVISDPFKQERREYPLRAGETLAAALMRLWPHGLTGAWRVYRGEVNEANEIAAVSLPYEVVLEGDSFIIVREPAGPAAPFLADFAVALFFSLATAALAPKPPRVRPSDPDLVSPNNLIAGQTNSLRPGARVPDILGRVRAFPDLLCNPVDVYNETQQTIAQMFVLGVGAYEVTDPKLGETPLASLRGSDLDVYLPGEEVPAFYVLKASREVGDVSLLGEGIDSVPVTGDTDFYAATKQMHTQEPLALGVGRPVRFTGTFFNNGVRWVTAIPPSSQTTPPYVYTLEGPVADEIGAEVSYTQIPASIAFSNSSFSFANGVPVEFPDEDSDDSLDPQQITFGYGWPGDELVPKVGDWVEIRLASTGQYWRGQLFEAWWPLGGRAMLWGIKMNNLDGVPQTYPNLSRKGAFYTSWREPPVEGGGGDPDPPTGGLTNAPTNWYAAPFADPEEIWIDIAFPQGMAFYDHGSRRVLTIVVRADFRRLGATDPQASVTFNFTYATAAPMRFTKRVPVAGLAGLGLPAGSSTIEVRLVRLTEYYADSANNNYVQETRWARLAAVRRLVGQTYPTATVLAFSMSNTRSATAVGDMQLNVIATRILPTWTGAAWSAPAPTRKWADNFVERCKATDGANRSDAQLDLAGIYALQTQLDSLDEGKQGEISLTLDQMQDIDSELAQIADVVRAVVYRVGRRLFVTRDQANLTTIALFNARTKSPEGETNSIRMTGDADNDCVIVTWMDENLAWKQRDYQYPEDALAFNPLRVPAVLANWSQGYRRALFEWNRLKYRREQVSCNVTEDGRICRPGDVVNMTDDAANLAETAGEVVDVAGAELTLDRDVTFGAGSYSIMLRDARGRTVDRIPCTAVGGVANKVTLARAPSVEIQGRDTARGTLFAFFPDSAATVRPWLLTSVQLNGPYVQLTGVNYSPKVYAGDSAPLPTPPPIPS